MGNTLKRILITVPLTIALVSGGMAGTAQAAAPATAHVSVAAAPLGDCYIYANGVLQWLFVARKANCISEAARVQALYPQYRINRKREPLIRPALDRGLPPRTRSPSPVPLENRVSGFDLRWSTSTTVDVLRMRI
jgi:hypothetical protein